VREIFPAFLLSAETHPDAESIRIVYRHSLFGRGSDRDVSMWTFRDQRARYSG
jgi:hypothetical protein